MTLEHQPPLFIQVDPARPEPIYQQIVDCVARAIAGGAARPGDPLPSVRELAVEQRVNLNTVSRAYQRLQDLGLVELRRGVGLFVANGAHAASPEDRLRLLAGRVQALVAEARQLGLPAPDVLAAVQRQFEEEEERP